MTKQERDRIERILLNARIHNAYKVPLSGHAIPTRTNKILWKLAANTAALDASKRLVKAIEAIRKMKVT